MGTARLTIRQYLTILRPYRRSLVAIITLIVTTILAADIAVPYFMAKVLAGLATLATNPAADLAVVKEPFAWFVATSLLGLIGWRSVGFWVAIRQPRMLHVLERHVFDRLTRHSYAFFANRFGGALVTQANRYVRSYESLEDTVFYQTLPLAVRLVASLAILLWVIPTVGLALLGWSMFFIGTTTWMVMRNQPNMRKASDSDSWITARLADVITNVLNLKSFGRTREEQRSFRRLSDRRRRIRRHAWFWGEAIWSYTHVLGVIVSVAVLGLSIHAVRSGGTGLAAVLLAQLYALRLNGDLSELQNILKRFSIAFGDAAEMTLILDRPLDVADPVRPEPVRIRRGHIALKRIGFRYRNNRPVFKDLSLEIRPGERVGLVGHSGSGKSTLVKVLLRFADVQAGAVTIDGQDVRRVRQDEFRSRIAYVSQEPVLFHRSLADNIRYAQPDATDREVRRVARLAHAAEFIDALPNGYDTLVGERGVKLSGGERQRVAIARAMLSDAPILVLDEATSSLDWESESLITDALQHLMKRRTTLVIAHRLSTIRSMDRIVVMEHGQIIEQGSHRQLLAKHGAYAELWQHQTGGFLDD